MWKYEQSFVFIQAKREPDRSPHCTLFFSRKLKSHLEQSQLSNFYRMLPQTRKRKSVFHIIKLSYKMCENFTTFVEYTRKILAPFEILFRCCHFPPAPAGWLAAWVCAMMINNLKWRRKNLSANRVINIMSARDRHTCDVWWFFGGWAKAAAVTAASWRNRCRQMCIFLIVFDDENSWLVGVL